MPDPTPTPAPASGSFWQQNKTLLTHAAVAFATAVLTALLTWLNVPPQVVEVVKEIPAAVGAQHPVQAGPPELPDGYATGWVPDADATAADARASQFRTFASTPAGQSTAPLPKYVFGWQAVQKLTGRPTPLKDQNPTGSCVGFGTTTSIERTEAAEIIHRGGDPSEFAFYSEEVTYAGSKVQGARSLGATVSRSDGSAGVFVKAFFAAGYGMCPKGKYGSTDLTTYDPDRAHSWNLSGPPAEVLAATRKYPVRDAVKVTSWDQAKRAMAQGYFVSVCASWKYSAGRDANGVARDIATGNPRLDWGHCMALDGYYTDADGTEYGHIENSWSNLPDKWGRRTGQAYHTGPVGWGNPTTAGFWATSGSVDRALRQGDSFGYSGITGFPARKMPDDWFIYRPAPKGRDELARRLERAFAPEWSLAP